MRRSGFVLAASFLIACGPARGTSEQAPAGVPQRSPSEPPPPSSAVATPPASPAVPDDPRAGEIFYHEVMLGGAKREDTVPMIVAIHGLGDTPRGFMHLFNGFPEKARLILPRAIDDYSEGGYSWFPIRARDQNPEGLAAGIERAATLLAASIDELSRNKPTLGKPIATGFSQGGMLTFALAVHHPETISAAVPVGGWLPPPLWPKKKAGAQQPPIFALHGVADNAVSYEATQTAVEHLTTLGYEAKLQGYEGVQHVITDEIRRDLHDALVTAVRSQEAKR